MSGAAPLERVSSIKVKLGLLVAVSVTVAAVLGTVSSLGGIPPWLAIPVTVALALGVTQLLASGMTAPLREMTAASRRMARGDHDVRVRATSSDEVGELARAFNAMAAELEDVDRQRRDLVATVAHELRTPLTALVAVLENLEDGVVPAGPDAVGTARAQAERLSRLVADLLDLSRLEAGAVALQEQDVEVRDLLDEAVAEAAALPRGVTFAVLVEPAGLVVRGDRARLQQLLANLLDNASRHSPAGGAVHVSAHRRGDDTWSLEVANPGAPIAAADRERVFERFGRLGDPDGGGTGLGLAIARWVTTLHGGGIRAADPLPGEDGARIVADLPLRPLARAAAAAAAPTVPVTTVPVPAPEGPPVTAVPATPTVGTPGGTPPGVPRPDVDVMADLTGRRWPSRPQPAPRGGLVVAALVIGLLAAVLVATAQPGLGYVLVLLGGAATVVAASPHRREPFPLACTVLAVPLVGVLMLRDAQWIGVLCALAASALCVLGSARARSTGGMLLAGLLWPLSALHALGWVQASVRALGGRGHGLPVLRTLVWSLVGVTTFGLLFASADALFRTWVGSLLPDLGDVTVFRIFVGLAVAALVLMAAYFALNPPRVEPATPGVRRPPLRRYEWLAPVLVVDLVFVVFLVAQAAAAFGDHAFVRRSTGLTYADYVHQGFGQLTVATALTLLVVWVVQRRAAVATRADRAWLRGALGVLCVLTLVVVASALHRMDLYQQAYGFTRLRLLVDTFEVWLGLLVLGVLVAGVRLGFGWLPRAAVLAGAGLLLVLALGDPDARIAQHNVERWQTTGKIDWTYLSGLSADATPTLVDLPAGLPRCRLDGDRPRTGFWDYNLGRARAVRALAAAPDPIGTPYCDRIGRPLPGTTSSRE